MNFKRFHESKNLLDLTALINAPSGTFTTQDGTETFTADHLLEIQLKPNTYYKMSSNYVKTGTKSNIIYLQYADSSKATTSTVSPSYKTNNTGVVKIAMYTSKDGADDFISGLAWVMLNEGDTPLPYEPYSSEVWHDIPHYIHNTSTDTITTLPAVLYPNAVTATVGLKGNMVQSGTPSPTTPIQPQECGERTGNLVSANGTVTVSTVTVTVKNGAVTVTGTTASEISSTNIAWKTFDFWLDAGTYYFSRLSDSHISLMIRTYDSNSEVVRRGQFTLNERTHLFIGFYIYRNDPITTGTIMVNTGSTALPYEPYGIKIPILMGGTTNNVYLGEVQTTRKIKKLVLTGEENWRYSTSSQVHWIENVPNDYDNTLISRITTVCTHYKCIQNNTGFSGMVNGDLRLYAKETSPIAHELYIKDETYTSAADFKSYLQQQYANGTPVTVWYVLATPTTGIVNEPIRKIGTYADEVSGITIPTIAGANTLSIGTTLQPSEVTATYKGWHPVADVHERESNYTIATMQALTIAQLQTHTISELQGGEWS